METDCGAFKLTVKGTNVDPTAIREKLEKKIKKTVELVSPQPKKDGGGGGDKKLEEKKAEKKEEPKKPKEPKKDSGGDKKPEEKKAEKKEEPKKPKEVLNTPKKTAVAIRSRKRRRLKRKKSLRNPKRYLTRGIFELEIRDWILLWSNLLN
ncbi:hypothetical protein ACB092_09G048100 [Castanea dentata]